MLLDQNTVMLQLSLATYMRKTNITAVRREASVPLSVLLTLRHIARQPHTNWPANGCCVTISLRVGFTLKRCAWLTLESLTQMTCDGLQHCSEYSTYDLKSPSAVTFGLHWYGPHGGDCCKARGIFFCGGWSPLVRTTWRGLLCLGRMKHPALSKLT